MLYHIWMEAISRHAPLALVKKACYLAIPGFFLCALPCAVAEGESTWRSSLFPADWKPGDSDSAGRFLHDFSYAGYRRGEEPIPEDRAGTWFDATKEPFSADPSGVADSTAGIQAALDAAGQAGGGVVYLPAGTYRVAPQGEAKFALQLSGNNVVLKGAGKDRTFLFNDSIQMRNKSVVGLCPKTPVWWTSERMPKSQITGDLPKPTRTIPVADVSLFAPGDLVLVRSDITQRFIDEVGMTGIWKAGAAYPPGIIYCRRVTAIDPGSQTVEVDVPLRGFLRVADNARVAKAEKAEPLMESGIEDFSIGMRQHPGGGLDDDDSKNATPGTTAYEIFRAAAVVFDSAENCWARRIGTFRPESNPDNYHLLSHGLRIFRSRQLTVEDCEFSFPQYRGEGGNGYMFTLYGNDCLLKGCTGEAGRHNYSLGEMSANGNVIVRCKAKDGRLPSDFHMFFSLANLFDSTSCDGDFLQAILRTASNHGVTTTQSVFWNTQGLRYQPPVGEYRGHPTRNPQVIVMSEQWGDGYVIGTRGPASEVRTTNFAEGIGKGDNLEPPSLYEEQLRLRLAEKKGGR